MYRYSPHMRGGDSGSDQLRRRVQFIFTLLLVVAVIALAIFGGNALRDVYKRQPWMRIRLGR